MTSLGHGRLLSSRVSDPKVLTSVLPLLRTWVVLILRHRHRILDAILGETLCATLVENLSSWGAKGVTVTGACGLHPSRHVTHRERSHLSVNLVISGVPPVRDAIGGALSFPGPPRLTAKSPLPGRASPRLPLSASISQRVFLSLRIVLPHRSRLLRCQAENSAHLPLPPPGRRRATIGGSLLLLCPSSS